MTKIKAHILTRGRDVKIKKVDPGRPHFEHRSGLYQIPNYAVNLGRTATRINPEPELVYLEGNPLPQSEKPQTEEEIGDFLDDQLVDNAIKQTAATPWKLPSFPSIDNPGQLLLTAFVLLVIAAMAMQLLGIQV